MSLIDFPPVESPTYQVGFTDGITAAVAALRELARIERSRARRWALSAAATALEREIGGPVPLAAWAVPEKPSEKT